MLMDFNSRIGHDSTRAQKHLRMIDFRKHISMTKFLILAKNTFHLRVLSISLWGIFLPKKKGEFSKFALFFCNTM